MNNQKSKNNKTKTTLGILVAIFIVMIGALTFWYLQIIQGAQKIKEDKKTYNQELKDAQFISEIKRQKEQVREIEEFLNGLYVPREDAVSFIEYVEGVANDAGVDLDITRFDIQNENVLISLSARGSWSENNRFLIMIENLPYYSAIESFNLKANNTGGSVVWESKFEIKALTK